MNHKMILVSILLFTFAGEVGNAKATSVKNKQAASAKGSSHQSGSNDNQLKSKLGTSFRFDGSSLHGKFQGSPSTTAMVEDDKFLDDLLGARKSFQDRIEKDRERN